MGRPGPERRSLVYLTGFMGSGKSTIGPILANTIGFDFADIDREIERRAGKRISEIFAIDGEETFRTIEYTALEDLSGKENQIVSLGGGTIANEQNFALIRRTGLIVYIQLSAEEIYQRVSRRSDRPMLRASDGSPLPPGQLEARIRILLAEREGYYLKADIIVDSDKRRVGATVDEIARRLRHYI
jgi:shikimate kinase